jgi:hypothetical protein
LPAAAHRGASADLFDDTDEDMRRLTADISRVLSGRPDLRIVGVQSEVGAAAGGLPITAGDEAANPFEWQSSEAAEKPRAPDQAAGWLSRAKRERRYARLRSALSWCVALGIAGVIVLAVAGSVRGAPVLLSIFEEIRRSAGL